MDITCDMCGKPCQDQGTQGRGETNALPHPPLPHDQPHPSYLTGTTASSPIRSTHIRQNPPRHIPAKRTQPAQPHPPRDQPRPSYPTGTPASSPIRSAYIRQSARNPRIHHAAQPPTNTPASHPNHSRAQNADHLAQNTPHSLNFTEVVCALGAHRTIGSTSKQTQWMRIRSTPLRRTHTPPQVQTTLSAVDSLGVLSCASW